MLSDGLTTSSTCLVCLNKLSQRISLQVSLMKTVKVHPKLNLKRWQSYKLLKMQKTKRKLDKLIKAKTKVKTKAKANNSNKRLRLQMDRKSKRTTSKRLQSQKLLNKSNNKNNNRTRVVKKQQTCHKSPISLNVTSELVKSQKCGAIPSLKSSTANKSTWVMERLARLLLGSN